MQHNLQLADQIVIVGYFALLAGIGLYFWRRMKHVRDLFTGSNNVPWWLAGVSFYLTAFSAFTFVAYSEMAYRYGFIAITLTWSSALAMVLGTVFLAGRWRRARIVSPVEFLEARYSPQIRQVLAWAGIPLKLIDDGLKIYATGIFVSAGLGYDLKLSVLACGVVMALYTFMGGLWAVVVTDYIQFVILTFGVAVLFPLVFAHMGGFVAGMRMLQHDSPPGFFSLVGGPYSLFYVIAFYLLVVLSYNGNWAFAQKFYSVRDEREARKAGALATVLKLTGPPLFLLPAMAARHLLPQLANQPGAAQYTYAVLALNFLPAGLVGLMIAAMFSATMSTLSGDFNVTASVITEDLYRTLLDRNASQRRLVLVGRLATLFAGAVTIAIGIFLVGTAKTGLFEVMVKLFTLFVGPMLIPMLAGLLSRRLTHRGAAAGIAAGFACGFGMYLYKQLILQTRPGVDPSWLAHDYEAISIFANFGVTIAAMVLTTLLEKRTPADIEKSEAFFRRLERPIRIDEQAAQNKNAFSPLPIIGWITAGVGVLLLIAAITLPPGSGRTINIIAGLCLGVIGAGFHALNQKVNRAQKAAPSVVT
ncbi:MAG TPA: sodium/solute symporter [Bryobacteraceae bacterium]|nr:sodium/solute symporter [Bryobacteraceae bacterium]